MKPELVSDERLEELYRQLSGAEQIPIDYGEFCVVARAVLAAVGVGQTEEVRLDFSTYGTLDCPFYGGYMIDYEKACGAEMTKCWSGNEFPDKRKWCPLCKGAILVRAKEKP